MYYILLVHSVHNCVNCGVQYICNIYKLMYADLFMLYDLNTVTYTLSFDPFGTFQHEEKVISDALRHVKKLVIIIIILVIIILISQIKK